MISNPHQPLLTRTAAPLSCPLACVGWLLTLVLTSLPATGQLVINEIVANNKNTIDDVDGESSDWIEILNTGSQLNLGGYSLTDDPAVPGKWTFPGGQFLGPNSYLVVFASGKDRAVLGQQLHTNFSLESDGEYLALCDPGGTVIHEFAPSFPNLKRDIGYGIGSDGTPGYLFPTTPNRANGNHLTGFVADTVFSHQRGFYDDPIEVIISSTTPGVSIRYTTNGREPTPSHGQIYTGPVTITSTTILRAVAYRTDMVPTNVDAKSYLYTRDIIEQSNMISSVVNSTAYRNEIQSALKEIPVVSLSFNRTALFGTRGIHNLPSLSGSTSEREAHFEYFDPSNPDDSTQEPAGIRIHGGNARQHPKKNFRLYFRSDYGKTRLNHNLFPESPVDSFKSILLRGGGHDAWTFRNDWNNASLIRNEFLHRLQQDMGQPSPYGRMVSLFLNGDYWGVYELQEFPHEHFNAAHHGGDPEDWDIIKHGAEVEAGDLVAWNELINMAENGIESDSDYAAIQRFIDIDNFADAMIHRIWSSDEDWLAPATRNGQSISTFSDDKNWYVARRSRNGEEPFIFYSWDGEMSMGIPFSSNEATGGTNPRSWQNDFTQVDNPDSPGIIYDALRQHPEFQLHFADRLHKHMFNKGALSLQHLQGHWDRLVDTVHSPIVGESARWGLDSWTGASRRSPYTRNSQWIPAVNWVRSQFLVNRSNTVLSQFNAVDLYPDVVAPMPSLRDTLFPSPVNLTLRTTSPGSTIYLTTDGADPRLPSTQGIVSFVTNGHPVEAHVPTRASNAEIGESWLQVADPSNIDDWVTGPNGVGYERFPASNPSYDELIQTELTDMYGVNPSAYIRYKFTISDQATIDSLGSLNLRIRYDDGFVAYLNGVQIESRNVGNTLWDSAASASHSDTAAVNYVAFDRSSDLRFLQPGENILAIHGFNRTPGSSDFLIQAVLEGDTGEPGGTMAPSARVYDGTMSLDHTTWLKARTRRADGTWSALLDILYQIGTPASFDNLRITEIHYHPTDPVTEAELALSDSDNDFEFLELQNVSDGGIDLSLCRFDQGIDFQFPPGTYLPAGQRALLVNNREAFLSRYGPSVEPAIFGEFGSDTNLSNKGERLALEDALGENIFSFPYEDEAPWPIPPDGEGPSLVLVDPLGTPEKELDEGSRWRTSHLDHGAPDLGDDWSYQLWIREFYGPLAASDPLLTDPDLVPGPGGLSNFMLYAQGYDLGATPVHQLSIVAVDYLDGIDYLTLTYQLRADLAGATVTAEVSEDLQTWRPDVVLVSKKENGDGTCTITVRDTLPVKTGKGHYIRVRIGE